MSAALPQRLDHREDVIDDPLLFGLRDEARPVKEYPQKVNGLLRIITIELV